MFNIYEKSTQMLRIGDDEDELKAMEDNKVDLRKELGKLQNKSRQDAKDEMCFYCGEKCSSFCNSHSVPAFLLRNIAVNGEVYSSNKLVSLPLLDEDKGVKQSGTFQLICRECDSKIFSDYEDPENYKEVPTPKMIAQIAIKNYLKSISKRKFEIALYDNMKNELGLSPEIHSGTQVVNNLDLKEYIEEFNRAKKIEAKGWDREYYLFYYQKLDYVVPIAFQNNITLLCDFEGATINNIYSSSPDYKIKAIHICVFPLEDSSIVMMFVDSKDKRYRKFYRQFNRLSHNDKLSAVNYIIFSYSEDFFINKKVNETVLKSQKLIEASRKTLNIISTHLHFDALSTAKENFDFSKMNEIPNLLLEEYKIR